MAPPWLSCDWVCVLTWSHHGCACDRECGLNWSYCVAVCSVLWLLELPAAPPHCEQSLRSGSWPTQRAELRDPGNQPHPRGTPNTPILGLQPCLKPGCHVGRRVPLLCKPVSGVSSDPCRCQSGLRGRGPSLRHWSPAAPSCCIPVLLPKQIPHVKAEGPRQAGRPVGKAGPWEGQSGCPCQC